MIGPFKHTPRPSSLADVDIARRAGELMAHTYSDACVCVICQGTRAKRRADKRNAFHEGQREAHLVTRTAYRLLEAKNKGRTADISRTGVVYERQGETLRRIGIATATKGGVNVLPVQKVKGKAARKAAKRARMQAREAAGARGKVGAA